MKHIEIDEELYQYLASNTQYIGESASSILRRLLSLPGNQSQDIKISEDKVTKTFTVDKKEPAPSQVKINKNKNVFDVINKEELAMQRGVVGRFLLLLSALHRMHGEAFSIVLNIRGRDRLYFADSEKALSESGSSTKPRQIPDSRFWVITNSNTTRKKMMITEVAKALGYEENQIEKIRDLL
ncbi:replication initiation negative regulator SeqA [Thalassotalea sediminis]|uniref:replication initiation negative regulator SeqA n=1 Tax=Thalassotalea sediminis TaxID=1759089 RepID=UPI002572E153|nr:replication initiation negative regulator SeqA [Thalassotalea sediminis]